MTSHTKEHYFSGNVIILSPEKNNGTYGQRNSDSRLNEAIGLAEAIRLNVVHSEVVRLKAIRPATYVGEGVVDVFKGVIAHTEAKLVIVNALLSPVQQRNLERRWSCKVIDRTGLILEIFSARARTSEGRLQVELASLEYQKSRLVRSWTHLERQRGGFGFTGGPGETQLEVDRRLIGERIAKLKKELETVKRTRLLHRQARKKIPYSVVALVGYTNAGKSTLFNLLTQAEVWAEDLLFATLDPTMRRLKLPSGRTVILSDTVGFISELPTQLIAAFHATLEEILAADVIVHVRDISDEHSEQHAEDVYAVLRELGLESALETHLVEALNKIDLLEDASTVSLQGNKNQSVISAVTGEGILDLLNKIDENLSSLFLLYSITLNAADGAALAWLYRHGQILDKVSEEDKIFISVKLKEDEYHHFQSLFLKGEPPEGSDFNSHEVV